ncbi:hypothetical protein [Streptomyces sp. NPDC059009]|uniref:hypothetical protein n=1 Tax=Streptomyces sp. NPDC059009 TaxID=3346694 RepID=UPI00369145DC
MRVNSPMHRPVLHGCALGIAAVLTLAAPAAADDEPAVLTAGTTVTPSGHRFSATAEGDVVLDAGPVKITCARSTTTSPTGKLNRIPNRPANTSLDGGPVTLDIAPPTFKECTTNAPGLKADITTNSDHGTWQLALHNGAPAELTIPAQGFTLKTSGLLSCAVTAAPDAAAHALAAWTNGAPSALGFAGAPIPVKIEGGFFCPTSITSAAITATYKVTDVTDPAQHITVGPAQQG